MLPHNRLQNPKTAAVISLVLILCYYSIPHNNYWILLDLIYGWCDFIEVFLFNKLEKKHTKHWAFRYGINQTDQVSNAFSQGYQWIEAVGSFLPLGYTDLASLNISQMTNSN